MLKAVLMASLATAYIVPVAQAQPGYGYGHRGAAYGWHRHHRLSHGTGYHGRGTATGGPVGGLPSRN